MASLSRHQSAPDQHLLVIAANAQRTYAEDEGHPLGASYVEHTKPRPWMAEALAVAAVPAHTEAGIRAKADLVRELLLEQLPDLAHWATPMERVMLSLCQDLLRD